MVASDPWSKISTNYLACLSFESLLTGWSLYSLRSNTRGKKFWSNSLGYKIMTGQIAWGFSAHFYLLPSAVLPGHGLSLTPSLSPRLCCMKSHIIWGTSFHCLKACQIWWKSCWQSVPGRCTRYDFLAATASCCVAVWLWRQEKQGPECGNQLCPQVCQSGVLSRQTL